MAQSLKPVVSSLDHLVLTVRDLQATCQFYETILGMTPITFAAADGTKRWSLKFGQQKINLHQVGSEFEPKAARPTQGSADLCFLTKTPLDLWQSHLVANRIAVEDGPVARTGATGPITSIYIRDPDENLVEISVEN